MVLVPLVDRESEWSRLSDHWDAVLAGGARLVLLSGRRRVGKTFLGLHLAEHARATGAQAVVSTPPSRSAVSQQLEALATALAHEMSADPWERFTVTGWADALDHLLARATRGPLLVVVDEAPYVSGADAPRSPASCRRDGTGCARSRTRPA